MRALHLIRHGKTAANEKRLYCGQSDIALSEAGRMEIVGLVEEGLYPSAAGMRFFTSGMARAIETLNVIYGPVQSDSLADISEYNFGEFEMHGYEDLKERADYQAWIMDTSNKVSCPAGESRSTFYKRVMAGFRKIEDSRCPAIVLCHGGVIACIMEHLYPGLMNFYEWQPAAGRGYSLFYAQGKLHNYKLL